VERCCPSCTCVAVAGTSSSTFRRKVESAKAFASQTEELDNRAEIGGYTHLHRALGRNDVAIGIDYRGTTRGIRTIFHDQAPFAIPLSGGSMLTSSTSRP
jgi:hypothetical protein